MIKQEWEKVCGKAGLVLGMWWVSITREKSSDNNLLMQNISDTAFLCFATHGYSWCFISCCFTMLTPTPLSHPQLLPVFPMFPQTVSFLLSWPIHKIIFLLQDKRSEVFAGAWCVFVIMIASCICVLRKNVVSFYFFLFIESRFFSFHNIS